MTKRGQHSSTSYSCLVMAGHRFEIEQNSIRSEISKKQSMNQWLDLQMTKNSQDIFQILDREKRSIFKKYISSMYYFSYRIGQYQSLTPDTRRNKTSCKTKTTTSLNEEKKCSLYSCAVQYFHGGVDEHEWTRSEMK